MYFYVITSTISVRCDIRSAYAAADAPTILRLGWKSEVPRAPRINKTLCI